jgi:hypothetical protein
MSGNVMSFESAGEVVVASDGVADMLAVSFDGSFFKDPGIRLVVECCVVQFVSCQSGWNRCCVRVMDLKVEGAIEEYM